MIGFDYWQDALDNLEAKKKETVKKLLEKYHGRIDEDEISVGDSVLLAGANSVYNTMKSAYNIAEDTGEFLADTKIAYDYYNKMNKTGRDLVNKYGRNVGAGDGIDNYYHALLQCELAKISDKSRVNGLTLGQLKEDVMDYPKKRFKGFSREEILKDSKKDLKNNELGSRLGRENLDKACEILLDYLRTENMRKERIR